MLTEPCPLDELHPLMKSCLNINKQTLLHISSCIKTEFKNKSLSTRKIYKESLDFFSRFIESQIETMYLLINYHIDQRLQCCTYVLWKHSFVELIGLLKLEKSRF